MYSSIAACIVGGLVVRATTLQAAGISPIGRRCGQLVCAPLDYCSEGVCEPCEGICSSENHNFDSDLCFKDCQNYLQDKIYAKGNEDLTALKGTVEHLEFEVSVMTTVFCLLLTFVVAFLLLQFFRNYKRYWSSLKTVFQKKKHARNMAGLELTHQNPHTVSPVQPRKNNIETQPREVQQGDPTPPAYEDQPHQLNQQDVAQPNHPQTNPGSHRINQGVVSTPNSDTATEEDRRLFRAQQDQTLDVSRLQNVAEEGNLRHHVRNIPQQREIIGRQIAITQSYSSDPNQDNGSEIETITGRLNSTMTDVRSPSEDCLLSYGVNYHSPNPALNSFTATNAQNRIPERTTAVPVVSNAGRSNGNINDFSSQSRCVANRRDDDSDSDYPDTGPNSLYSIYTTRSSPSTECTNNSYRPH